MDTQRVGVHMCRELVLNTFTPQLRKHACAHSITFHIIQAVSTQGNKNHLTLQSENSEPVMDECVKFFFFLETQAKAHIS